MSLDLYVDTSRKGVSMALATRAVNNAQKPVYEEIVDNEARGEVLGAYLDRLLERTGATLEDVTRVMVTLGPGSFSGLRTGVAFCEGLCFSGKRKLYGVTTLQALECFAGDAHDTAGDLPAADARTAHNTAGVPRARECNAGIPQAEECVAGVSQAEECVAGVSQAEDCSAQDVAGVSQAEDCAAGASRACGVHESPSATAVVIRARNGFWYLRLDGQESFVETPVVLDSLRQHAVRTVVADSPAMADESLKAAFTELGARVVPDSGLPLRMWEPLFSQVKPSLMQEANYIQPSYFEKLKA